MEAKYNFEVGKVFNNPSRLYVMVRNNRTASYIMQRTAAFTEESKDKVFGRLVRIAEKKFGKRYNLIVK